jgi:hypothetical protein
MSDILTSPRPSRFGRAVGFRLAGIGSHVPPQVVTNADLARLGCDPEWIVARSGIHERRHASPETATSDLAAAAGRAALEHAGVRPADVDLLVLGTFTPDMCIPSAACIVQDKLGLDAPAMDVTAACAGFAYALVTASQFLTGGTSRLALVIGADTNSRVVDPEDIKTWPRRPARRRSPTRGNLEATSTCSCSARSRPTCASPPRPASSRSGSASTPRRWTSRRPAPDSPTP